MDEAGKILELDVDPHDPDTFGTTLRAKTSVISVILPTQAKVDETRLRRHTMDRLPALLALVNATAARLPPV